MNYFDPENFYFNSPLYFPINITEDNKRDFVNLMRYDGKIDGYSPNLRENTTFDISPMRMENEQYFFRYGGINSFRLTCVRTGEEFNFFINYDTKKNTVQKIGQFPSIATLHISQIKKYDKVLSKERIREFTRAIGLAANGIGIGSFVYLRRIFEELIEESHLISLKETDWDETEYKKQRMPEKIEMLKKHLPEFLVDNKNLYGILSVGIHSLKEEDCLAYFETVKVGIELILDEKVEILKKRLKLEEAKQKIQSLSQQIKPK